MTEIHISVGGDFMPSLRHATGLNDVEVIREALTLFAWAVQESQNGRLILTCGQDGTDAAKLSATVLNDVRRRSES